jgi:phenylalanyl-tRNA synthetase beta chain
MKIAYNWLKAYLNFEENPEEISKILTETGLEVEGLQSMGAVKGGLQGVVVGEVMDCTKHPDADKLKVTSVNIGSEILQIVCGASNVATGQKVLVALVGTTIYPITGEPLTLRKAKIRGLESHGMICAEDELGTGTSHDGILVLDPATPVGIPAAVALNIEMDYTLEIGLTPNRSDAMGHIGVARDLKAYLNFHKKSNLKINWPSISCQVTNEIPELALEVTDASRCPSYFAAKIKNVKVEASPDWLQKRLSAVGATSVNNVVDVTNFVMRELGTPLHAFDARHFRDQLHVRLANSGEMLITLDGSERKLKENDLVIANVNGPQCLAGVMGGKDSGVSETTVDILIESAYFEPTGIRKSAKQHGIHSESSFRFERGVDPELTLFALQRAIDLILETAGGELIGITEKSAEIQKAIEIPLDFKKINASLGSALTDEEIHGILADLDFTPTKENHWLAPLYRTDVCRPIDVTEEIIRIAGFDAIIEKEKWHFSVPISDAKRNDTIRTKVAQAMVGMGFNEILSNSLTKESNGTLVTDVKNGAVISLLNPLSRDLSILRNSMLFGLLETIAHNQNRQSPNLRIFEFGQTYHAFGNKNTEKPALAMAITGKNAPESWLSAGQASFFMMKGIVMQMLTSLSALKPDESLIEQSDEFEGGIALKIQGKTIATLGKIKKSWQQKFDIKQEVFAALIDWKVWTQIEKSQSDVYQELPKTFQSRRDFSLLIDTDITFVELVNAAKKASPILLKDTQLFDVYEGDKLEAGKKSYAMSFHFQDNERTLTDAEIDAEMHQIRESLSKNLGARLR